MADAYLIRDVENSPAHLILEDLFKKGKLTQAQAMLFKQKYQKIHEHVTASLSDESLLLEKAKELKNMVRDVETRVQKEEDKLAVLTKETESLRREEEQTQREARECQDQLDTTIGYELEELQGVRKERRHRLEDKHRRTLANMELEIVPLREQIEELTESVKKSTEEIEKENQAVREYQDSLERNSKQLGVLDKAKLNKREVYHHAMQEPEKLRKSIAVVESLKDSLSRDSNKLVDDLKRIDHELEELQQERRYAEEDIKKHKEKKQNFILAIARRQQELDDIAREMEQEKQKHLEALESQNEAAEEKEACKIALRHMLEEANRHQKEYDETKREYVKLKNKTDTIVYAMPGLEQQVEMLTSEVEELRTEERKKRRGLIEIKNDEEIFISQFLAQEKLEEDALILLKDIETERKEYETKIKVLDRQERDLASQVQSLSSQRELVAREASRATAHYREAKETLKIKNLILVDLDKQTHETFANLNLVNNKYEKMKNQRNKLANLTASQTQAVAEMKEKNKILQNEVEILRNESLARDRALAEEMRIHQSAKNTRDAERFERDKLLTTLRQKKELQKQQLMEIEKYNSIVNTAEKQMMALRTEYAQAVDSRNLTGIQLIDRNDECCILYEKKNIQADILKKGEGALTEIEEQIKLVRINISETQRKVEVSRKKIPSLAVYADAVKQLETVEKLLAQERKLTTDLCEQLETPHYIEGEDSATSVDSRSRLLGGMDPEPEQLAAKTEILEERLNDKKEQLLEKELVLDEVSSLTDKLRMQAAENRGNTLVLAQKVNSVQGQIRAIVRKMMATVSELSMYQATAMKLEQQKGQDMDVLQQARVRLDQGLPPTEQAEQEWYRMERDRIRRQESLLERNAEKQALANAQASGTLTRTTAGPRPNAYVTEELGLPKPYGNNAPFKPSVMGSNMRHIRRPQPKPIVL